VETPVNPSSLVLLVVFLVVLLPRVCLVNLSSLALPVECLVVLQNLARLVAPSLDPRSVTVVQDSHRRLLVTLNNLLSNHLSSPLCLVVPVALAVPVGRSLVSLSSLALLVDPVHRIWVP
jgi:hypothetical protein